ncbi:MAG: hypothetical protein K0Q53_1955 [Massilibacillus sp.]|nr:hypothetical protein [Massilibacillus sp.]
MSFLSKRNLIVLSAGAVLFTGILNPFIASASPEDGTNPAVRIGQPQTDSDKMQQADPDKKQQTDSDKKQQADSDKMQQIDPDKIAQNLSDMCGVDKKEIIAYMNKEVPLKDISTGAFVAKASGQSFKKVMDLKKETPDWQDVTKALGVTEEKVKETHNDVVSKMFEAKLNIPKETSLALLQKGCQSYDIAIANAFANDTKKSITDVLDMKKDNNRWEDVAASLGISEEAFRKDMDSLKSVIF